jgi:two-component sensor histidine kinase
MADVSRADVMVLVRQGDEALVVAQVKPRSIASLYRSDWIGRRLALTEKPLLAAALFQGRQGRQQVTLLAQGTAIIERVMPILGQEDQVLAVEQAQTSLIAWERHKRRHQSFRRAVKWLQEMVLRGELESAAGLRRFGEWDGILYVDDALIIRYLSGIANNLYRRLGYLEDLHGKHIGDLQTKDELLVRQALETGQCQKHQAEEGYRHWIRTVVPLRSAVSRWRSLGRNGHQRPQPRGALIMVHDETEAVRKAQELNVLATMIKEVHHRVKNNLQTVASILRMQARRADSEEARIQLSEAVNRVLAVSVIHEFLSRDEEQSINIREVCQRIVAQTQRAAVHANQRITLAVEGMAIYLPSQQATACALVANELLLNALEHGLQDQDTGHVTLTLTDLGDEVQLEVWDSGRGLPAGFDLSRADSLGLSIVRTLVEGDLRGRFCLEPALPGTRALVVFPKARPGDE